MKKYILPILYLLFVVAVIVIITKSISVFMSFCTENNEGIGFAVATITLSYWLIPLVPVLIDIGYILSCLQKNFSKNKIKDALNVLSLVSALCITIITVMWFASCAPIKSSDIRDLSLIVYLLLRVGYIVISLFKQGK